MPQDVHQAVYWWGLSADKGDSQAQRRLADAYFNGLGIPVDLPLAAHWYQMAARSGDFESVEVLAGLYRAGTGVSIDYPKAVSLYRQAARKGSTSAQLSLGDMYEAGQGVPRNLVAAFAWNDLVIERKSTPADRQLELLARQSLPPEALKALDEFAAKQRDLASGNVARLSKVLAPSEIAKARLMVSAWQPGLELDDPGASPKQ